MISWSWLKFDWIEDPDKGRNVNSEITPGSLKTLIATVLLIIFAIKVLWHKKQQLHLRKMTSYILFLNFTNFSVMILSKNWGSMLINFSFEWKKLCHTWFYFQVSQVYMSVIWSFSLNLNEYLHKNFVLYFERLARFTPNFVPTIPECYCGYV